MRIEDFYLRLDPEDCRRNDPEDLRLDPEDCRNDPED